MPGAQSRNLASAAPRGPELMLLMQSIAPSPRLCPLFSTFFWVPSTANHNPLRSSTQGTYGSLNCGQAEYDKADEQTHEYNDSNDEPLKQIPNGHTSGNQAA